MNYVALVVILKLQKLINPTTINKFAVRKMLFAKNYITLSKMLKAYYNYWLEFQNKEKCELYPHLIAVILGPYITTIII